jgi:hypothetical protein
MLSFTLGSGLMRRSRRVRRSKIIVIFRENALVRLKRESHTG